MINSQGTTAQKTLLGTASTNWNDQIYQTAFGTDNNFSVAGRIAPNWPIRVSVGYYGQNGLLTSDYSERFTGNLSLTPVIFQRSSESEHQWKSSINNNDFANHDAIWAASTFNPTLPVYSGNDLYGGYWEAIDSDGKPVNAGVRNPKG